MYKNPLCVEVNDNLVLDSFELEMIRDDVHRAFEEKDSLSLELGEVWLEFTARLGDPAVFTAPDSSGCLRVALAKNGGVTLLSPRR